MNRLTGWIVWGLACLALAVPAAAQNASGIAGVVRDASGGVLPGVTVTAANEATGNTFTGVTDERGDYRIPVRVGTYKITAEGYRTEDAGRGLAGEGRRSRYDPCKFLIRIACHAAVGPAGA